MRVVRPPANHSGYSSLVLATDWKHISKSLCNEDVFFHRKFTIRSGPGEDQFFFLRITLTASSLSNNPSESVDAPTRLCTALLIFVSHFTDGSLCSFAPIILAKNPWLRRHQQKTVFLMSIFFVLINWSSVVFHHALLIHST